MEEVTFQGISKEDYLLQRRPRCGTSNSERMDVPFWKEMVRHKCNAWAAREAFEDNDLEGPIWCFDRFGMSRTDLDHDTVLYVGGEHEDFYDPDFFIYNDVIMCVRGDNDPLIVGYPEDLFPPTDFHSATEIGGALYIIGGLGYQWDRVNGQTNVFRLEIEDFSIQRIETTGNNPGWIWNHQALFLPGRGAIAVWGGSLWNNGIHQNRKLHMLDLTALEWRELDQINAQDLIGPAESKTK